MRFPSKGGTARDRPATIRLAGSVVKEAPRRPSARMSQFTRRSRVPGGAISRAFTLAHLTMPTIHPLVVAAMVGALSGTHAAIWGMYKDSIYEGFSPGRFIR